MPENKEETLPTAEEMRAELLKFRAESCENLAAACDEAKSVLLKIAQEAARVCPVEMTVQDIAFWMKQVRGICKTNAKRYELMARNLRDLVESDAAVSSRIDAVAEGEK